MPVQPGDKTKSANIITHIRSDVIKFPVSPREQLYHDRIQLFTELIQSGQEFDPIVVTRTLNDEFFYCLDGRHRFEAHIIAGVMKIKAEIQEVPKKYWLLTAGFLNSKATAALTREEVRKLIKKCYLDYRISENEIHEKYHGIYPKRFVEDILRECRCSEKENKKQITIELKKNGKKFDEIVQSTGVPERTVKRWMDNANCEENSIDQFESSWKILKRNVSDVFSLTPKKKQCLFEIHGIKSNKSLKDMGSYHKNSTTASILSTAYAMLMYYQDSKVSAEEIVEKIIVLDEKADFIVKIMEHMSKTVPTRRHLFNWLNGNKTRSSHYHNELLRKEKIHIKQKENHADSASQNKIVKTIPNDFYTALNASVTQVTSLSVILNDHIQFSKKQTTTALALCNTLFVLLRKLQQKLGSYV